MNALGLDIGTTTISAVALGPDGRVLEALALPNGADVQGEAPGPGCKTRTPSPRRRAA